MGWTLTKISAFVLLIVSAYAYLGQLVPQFEEHAPAKRTISVDTNAEELASIGRELLRGKGGCLVCHKDGETGNERGPDLRQALARAASRKPGMSAEDYLLESLTTPDAFVVTGYPNIMPSALKPPANLTPAEVKAVVSYLQVLGGGEVTMRIASGDLAAGSNARQGVHRGRELMDESACTGCHLVNGEGGTVGPDLTKVAAARTPEEILRKMVNPAAWTTKGFEAGKMPSFEHLPEGERHEIVAYLVGLAGGSYSPTGAASPWSHEGVRLGLVILVFNLGMALALVLARRWEGKGASS
ncbi:c-type cytochrome [Bradyrhizobium sp.]|uniref:c-type cytochrome n=1 Tax=Bradyrhizobium sp. TaxID=376 RepID=UPI004037DC0D